MKWRYQVAGKNQISDPSNYACLSFDSSQIRKAVVRVKCQFTSYLGWNEDTKSQEETKLVSRATTRTSLLEAAITK